MEAVVNNIEHFGNACTHSISNKHMILHIDCETINLIKNVLMCE